MLKLFFTTICILSFYLQAKAATDSEQIVIIKKDTASSSVVEDSSEFNRLNKKYSIYLESAGGRMASGGLGIAYFLNRKSQILVDTYGYSTGFSELLLNSLLGVQENVNGSSLGVHYKSFVGNSFFIRGGLDVRRLRYERSYKGGLFNLSSTEEDKTEFVGSSTNAVVGIGNDWQWKNFTMGFDWIRIHMPISYQVDSSKVSSNDAQFDLKSKQEYYLKNSSAFMGFHLGASF